MKKQEQLRRLDHLMLRCMNSAIESDKQKCLPVFREHQGCALGVALSASMLGLISDEDFYKINHCISFM